MRRSKIAGALYLLWLAYRALRHGTALKLKAGAGGGGLRGAFLNGLADQPHRIRRSCCSS